MQILLKNVIIYILVSYQKKNALYIWIIKHITYYVNY
jgi:hypothetical protein